MNLIKAVVLLITGGAALVGMELSAHVHSARWEVKTCEDSFVPAALPITTTIPEQAALPAPHVGEQVTRLPSERTLYTLSAQLLEVKKEFDGDYHLVLQDTETKMKMVAEIPDTNAAQPATYRNDFATARAKIDRLVGKPGLFSERPKGKLLLQITGIGFFDEPHIFRPDGMAPNGREIHPVLKVQAG